VSITAKDVAEILRVLNESRFDELDLDINGVKLSLRRGAGAVAPGGDTVRVRQPSPVEPTQPDEEPTRRMLQPIVPLDSIAVPSPLLGVFYRAPKPGDPPFVEVGSRVAADTIIGIIEVMKLMNTVRAGVAGEVIAIAATNGELIEFGETILFVRKD
jgi:acetyl-CoA carboxylase biotin carboxyl carrier protein